ncbi:MAG: VanW family protein [Armatimonadota bacterium]|nr:VanW family protein [Armatimonadota bacterium]
MRWIGGVLAVFVALLAGAAAAYVLDERSHAGTFYDGIWIEDLHLGGLTREQALEHLRARVQARVQRPIVIRAGDRTWRRTAGELGLRSDLYGTVRRAFGVGRAGGLVDRLRMRWRLRSEPLRLAIPFSVDPAALRAFVDQAAAQVGTQPQDARLWVQDGQVRIVPGRDGTTIDHAAAARILAVAAREGWERVTLPLAAVRPRWTAERLQAMGIREVVATYTTHFPDVPNRNFNIALAASKLRGILLLTGEEFSFNRVVGPRTRAAGYREAPVILNDEFVPGDGGGVCQVSSTLFNVVLFADLKILARTNHSAPVSYLPLGRDAAVSYGSLDLRFRNDGPPLLMWAEVRGRALTISLYGTRRSGREVAILVTDVQVLPAPEGEIRRPDPGLPVGATQVLAAKRGFRATTVRIVREQGVVVRREVVAHSYYKPVPKIVKFGTRKQAALRGP